MKPLNNRIVVTDVGPAYANKSAILIPDESNDSPQCGKVYALGVTPDGSHFFKSSIESGDTVLYKKNSGIKFTHNDTEYTLLHEDEILIIL